MPSRGAEFGRLVADIGVIFVEVIKTGTHEMTEAEILELVAIYAANSITAFTVYISFTFAFLVTAFYVGRQLTLFQVFAISGMYIISAGSALLAEIAYLQAMFRIKAMSPNVLDEFALFNGDFWVIYMGIVLGAGMLVSLYFLWDMRRSDAE